jgi:hypothetical protein
MQITEFVLFKKENSPHLQGYAKYFGLEKRECIVKWTKNNYIVLVKNDEGEFERIGLYYPAKGKIRGAKEYELVGTIWTPDYTYHVVKDGNRFLAF